jgi:Subtilisin-like serine proteases
MIQKVSPVLLRPEFTENPDQPCRLIVEMASTHTDRVASYIEASEGRVHREMKLFPVVVVEVPYSALELMTYSPHIRKIWHDVKVRTLLDIAVPTAGGLKARDLGFTGKDVTVAVIDTGIFPHPDLIYPESRIVAWHDLVNDRSTPYDDNGHGTHVSGIIAGNGSASRGKYVGMASEAKLVGVKALNKDGEGNTSDVISALEWCMDNQKTYNIRAINLSLGSAAQESAREDPLCRAVSAAWASGIVVCVAAGNDGPNVRTINTPGITANAITVGNLDDKGTEDLSDDVISDSSSRGPTIDNSTKPDLLAPGTNITSLRAGGGYRSLSGTSMATPMVTGAVAQILQKSPNFKPDQVKTMLQRNARNMGMQSTFMGSGALAIAGIFEEPKKDDKKQRSFFSMLFGNHPASDSPVNDRPQRTGGLFPKLFGKKDDAPDSEAEKTKSSNFNPLSLALLALIPLAIV